MSKVTPIQPKLTNAFARDVIAPIGCCDFGLSVYAGSCSWGAHESGEVILPASNGLHRAIPVGYDRHGAPYVCVKKDAEPKLAAVGDSPATEDESLLISLTDEKTTIACVWAQHEANSPLLGIGVDLVDITRFDQGERSKRLARLLFSEREQELCCEAFGQDAAFGHAVLFGAKEAAFKACAAPLRVWERRCGELPGFEVRHFATRELAIGDISGVEQSVAQETNCRRRLVRGVVRGEERDGAAQAAMDRMGIARIETYAIRLGNLALVVAVALCG